MTSDTTPMDLRKEDLLYAMLLDPWSWRERSIERLSLAHGHHIEVSSRYQVHLKSEELPIDVPVEPLTPVRLLLPLSTRAKQPLLNFTLHGPVERPKQLLTRRDIARLQAGLIGYMLEPSDIVGQLSSHWPTQLLQAIFHFTPHIFLNRAAEVGWPSRLMRKKMTVAYQRYLYSEASLDLSAQEVKQCLDIQDEITPVLAEALDEDPDPYSSAEQPLLALPELPRTTLPTDGSQVIDILQGYLDGIRLARDDGQYSILAILAEYGRRWQVIVDTTLVLNERQSVGTTEHAPFGHTKPWYGKTFRLVGREKVARRIDLLDAPSLHCEVQTADHRVELTPKYTVMTSAGSKLGFPFWESIRYTPEFLSLYTAKPRQHSWGTLIVRLRSVGHVRWPTRFIIALTLASVIAAFRITASSESDLLAAFALLTFPTTFAVALLLLREGSGLSARLQYSPRLILTILAGALWAVVLARMAVILRIW